MASKRPSSLEDGVSEGWPGCGPKRRCCCRQERGYTLEDFMKKLDAPDLQLVQQLLHKYHISFRHISSSLRSPTNRLHFRSKLPNTIFTDRKIKADNNTEVEIVILDASDNVINSGPLASAEIEIFVLDGDFDGDALEQWSNEELNNHMVFARKDKKPLLIGKLLVKLCNGVGFLSNATFTDNSSWVKNKMFRLVARYCGQTSIDGVVQEGISSAFRVKDRHGESKQKDHPPSLTDEVCCLKGIFRNGPFHKKLVDHDIKTVLDFLCSYSNYPEKLQSMLGMPKGAWKKTLNHALDFKGRSASQFTSLGDLPVPCQGSFEVTASSSFHSHDPQNLHNGTNAVNCGTEIQPFPSSTPGIPSIAKGLLASCSNFSPRNSFKAINITGGQAWQGTDQLDISWEMLMAEDGTNFLPKMFDHGSPLPFRKWGHLLFVAKFKRAALRFRKTKYLAPNSSNDDNGEPIWEDLSPLSQLTP